MGDSHFISHFDVSGSALAAERDRMRLISSNIANVNTTRTEDGGPYQRHFAILESHPVQGSTVETGVQIKEIVTDTSAPRLVYDPKHPDANQDGYVAMPNVDLLKEVTDLKSATMAYQANVSVVNATKAIITKSLSIGQ